MTEEELNRLEALAKAATSGPWARHPAPGAYAVHQPEFECWIPQDGNDADFIAEANPNTILSLISLARVGLAAERYRSARLAFDEYDKQSEDDDIGPEWGRLRGEVRDAWAAFSALPKPGVE